MAYGWEGNRRSGVALAMRLAMRHTFHWFIDKRVQWLTVRDEQELNVRPTSMQSFSRHVEDSRIRLGGQ